MRRFFLALIVALTAVLAVPQLASAHVERPSYWPDPKPDCTISPCAGGKIPAIRSLASALTASAPGTTRVVCKPDSLTRLKASIANARQWGYRNRATVLSTLTAAQATQLLQVNTALFAMCSYSDIQPAVTASGNNDRVVVMPGLYTEPASRAAPTFDPACDKYETKSDGGDPGALSHEYQIHCPNDANLISVVGRDGGAGQAADPSPPLVDRHGIPNPGKCIRCNLQLEGSGVSDNDVVVEAGDAAAGNGGPSAVGHAKDVGIFVDRADGFVLRNLTVRHAREHDIYILETDGYVFDKFKTFYAGSYGVLTFVEDHGLIQNCEAAGNGDSGIYPGAGAPTLTHRDVSFYPTARYSQTVQYCDSHHNTGGFSGTDSHGTLIQYNNFFDNSLGFTTDVFTAAGHPGFPQEGNVIRNNNFYSNNFNAFAPGSDVAPFIGAPVGTGLWLAGGNDNVVQGNHFYDNWRRGLMLFAVPDATVCGPVLGDTKTPIPGCSVLGISTSFRNKFSGNVMGVAPGGVAKPNGTDFWWDSFPTNTGNCWWGNTAAAGKKVTTNGLLPNCANGTLPATSIGLGNVLAEAELVACLAGYQVSGYPNGNGTICSWSKTPAKPGSASAARMATSGEFVASDGTSQTSTYAQKQAFAELCASAETLSRTCAPFATILNNLGWVAATLQPQPADTTTAAVTTRKPLGLYTCEWWRKADDSAKAGMVQRIRNFAGGSVTGSGSNGVDKIIGYGNVLTNANATKLFNERCSTSYAGPFALYKLYGAAAAYSVAQR
ncbi:right-handed parallel beta-helix repeat-containing protein [Nocardioides marmorisolisilvae]|uniref:Right-handed parallel beta-helix repeat-containing protein n=1 Tax=Nocardioides marmorisolisilvae TaxID=1542737 RepID=A0A3N0DTE8_9ACTN|nr:right-handed parallel beta-helix repeat-containing protein [Nocardioides marmorisolisilvae]RNL78899.1 right-handed parallel beta-helix repeat-containing protein [Nocardioides marmorisolisilvae]